MVQAINNLSIETTGTEEEAAECLEAALRMEVNGYGEGEGEVEEGGEGNQWSLGAPEFLTEDANPSGTAIRDARNGFNKLSRLSMMWTVRHRWPAGARFAFN